MIIAMRRWPELRQVLRDFRRGLAVHRHDQILRIVERRGNHANVRACQLAQHFCKRRVLRDRRQHHHAVELLARDEAADIGQELVAVAVARMHDELIAHAAQRAECALLEVDHVRRVRVVVDQPDQERAPERERARLRIRREADALDDLGDACARFLAHERRFVDDARNGLLGNVRQPGDIVDGVLALDLCDQGRRLLLRAGLGGSLRGQAGDLRGGFLGHAREDCNANDDSAEDNLTPVSPQR
jgi:hypothetical protein